MWNNIKHLFQLLKKQLNPKENYSKISSEGGLYTCQLSSLVLYWRVWISNIFYCYCYTVTIRMYKARDICTGEIYSYLLLIGWLVFIFKVKIINRCFIPKGFVLIPWVGMYVFALHYLKILILAAFQMKGFYILYVSQFHIISIRNTH